MLQEDEARVVPVTTSPTWEPNVPDAVMTTDDLGVTRLSLNAHFDDPDQSRVIIQWSGTVKAIIGYPNDEGRAEHPLYAHGLDTLLWMGEVIGDPHATPRHFILPLKESTAEVVADGWQVLRGQSPELMTIGYWGSEGNWSLPDPSAMVDPSWDEDERFDVSSYLDHQPIARAFMGYSPCRMCG